MANNKKRKRSRSRSKGKKRSHSKTEERLQSIENQILNLSIIVTKFIGNKNDEILQSKEPSDINDKKNAPPSSK